MKPLHLLTLRSTWRAAPLLLACLAAQAQYKVVGPDGRVTYTDRPPVNEPVKVTTLRGGATVAPAASGTPLPAELRPLVQRFPVVLFSAPDCDLCDNARRMLRQRGIPITERQVLGNDDLPALERLTGSRALPAITVGAQAAVGYSESQWGNLLDLAGYPRESKLPRDYAAAPATPLVVRQAAVPLAPPPAAPPAPAPAPAEPAAEDADAPQPSIRF